MVQKFRTYKRVRSNKAGFARFSAINGKAEDRYVTSAALPASVKVGTFARFQRYTNHETTTYDLLNNGKRVYSYVKDNWEVA